LEFGLPQFCKTKKNSASVKAVDLCKRKFDIEVRFDIIAINKSL
jgi:hypothetical protein